MSVDFGRLRRKMLSSGDTLNLVSPQRHLRHAPAVASKHESRICLGRCVNDRGGGGGIWTLFSYPIRGSEPAL